MTAELFNTPSERMVSGAMALVMHALFLALLIFGVAWQKPEPVAMVVDLWNNLPPAAVPKAEPAPDPKPEAKPEPRPEPKPEPKPVPKVEAKPVPKAEPKPVPKAEPKPDLKADIALREKKEKERKAAEEKALAEKKKREQAQAQVAVLKEQQAKERAAREQEDALRKLAQQQAAAQSKLIDEYKRRIGDKIKRFIVEPPNLQGNPEVEFDVVLLPGGEVLGVKTRRASAVAAWDSAVERAIMKAQPLPLPPDPAMFKDFRELNLKFRPKE